MSKARGPYRVDPLGYKKKADEALDRMAENARELELDYEPAQQEPVAWMQEMPTQEGETRSVRMTTLKEHATLQWGNPIPLYTAPPQRTWVGLTDEEIDQGLLRSDYAFKTAEAWRAGVVFAMTKLKEKNT